jgi:Tfp pilus assembly protein PilF/type III secretion system FlhB-like substrate exporter
MDELKTRQYTLLPFDKLPEDIGDPGDLIKKITKKVAINPLATNLNSVFQWANLAKTVLHAYSDFDKKMTAKLEFELGSVYLDSSNYKESKKLFESAIEKYIKQKPMNKKMLSASFRYLSMAQIESREYDSARMNIGKAMEWDKENCKNHYTIAQIFAGLGENVKAEEQYKKAIEMCIRKNGNKHMETASFYGGYGLFLLEAGKLESAKEYLCKSYRMMNHYYGEEHLYAARCLGHMSRMFFEEEKYNASFEAMDKSLISLKKILGGKNKETLIAKEWCAHILPYRAIELEPYIKKLERICILIAGRKELYVAPEYNKNIEAPRLILRGTDFNNIISDCKQHNIVIKYNKKTAGIIYNNTKIGQEIPPETYKAVAKLFAECSKMNKEFFTKTGTSDRVKKQKNGHNEA